jgi:hypothetical protein
MRIPPILVVFLLLWAGWGGWHWLNYHPFHPQDGVLAPEDPLQEDLDQPEQLTMGRWQLTARARYHITARILSRESYSFDRLASLIPLDLALGWGPMSDNRVLKRFDITQNDRFYFWHTDAPPPLSREDIISHSANTHLIPRDKAIARKLNSLRQGQVVTLVGELVDAKRDDGLYVHTSLTRFDTGAGACEVMLVSDVVLL